MLAKIENGLVSNILVVDGDIPVWAASPEYVAIPADKSVGIGWRYENGEFVAPAVVAPTLDEIRAAMPPLSAKQIRLGLLSLGKLDGVDTAIEAMPEPDKSEAKIQWEYATEFRRLHPLILRIMPILGLTDEQVDAAWMQFVEVE